MSRIASVQAAAAACTLTLSLVACGGPAPAPAESSGTPAAGASATTTQAAHVNPHTRAPKVASTGPKPSQEEVVAGLQKYYQGVARVTGVPANSYDAMTTCLVGKLYDGMTVQTANALRAGVLTRIHPDDGPAVAKTTAECAEKTVPGALGPSDAS